MPTTTSTEQAFTEQVVALLGRGEAAYDADGQSWAARVTVAGDRFEVLMPAVGALFPLWFNGKYRGGLSLRYTAETTPSDLADALVREISLALPY